MKKNFIDQGHPQLSVRRQAALVNVNRNRLDACLRKLSEQDERICAEMDKVHLERPYYGQRRMRVALCHRGLHVGRKRVRRLMRHMGLRAVYPKPNTSAKSPENPVYPYLLRGLTIDRPNQVWCADITYIPMARGFAYLVAIMDWSSRAVLGWRISNTLDASFCVGALRDARARAGTWPEIMNTDQGCQFTSEEWTNALKGADVQISMDGKGRWVDNVIIERLWRSLKYEDIYLREYRDLVELEDGVARWMEFYNYERPHQSQDNKTPWSVWSREPEQRAA